MNKRVITILTILLVLTTILVIGRSNINSSNLRTDSGFDTDYGSSSSSSGSYSSSNDTYHSNHNSTTYNNKKDNKNEDPYKLPVKKQEKEKVKLTEKEKKTILIIIAIIIILIFIISVLNKKTTALSRENNVDLEISEERLQKFLPEYTLKSIKKELYERFITIQKAWMDFDYDTLKDNCTDELYNSYRSQLEVLKMKNEKNTMTLFNKRSMIVSGIYSDNNIVVVEVLLAVTFIDYIKNTITNKIVKGNYSPITNCYEMTFVRNNTVDNLVTCPHCGNNLNINVSQTCPYCNSVIVVNPNKLVLNQKINKKTIR